MAMRKKWQEMKDCVLGKRFDLSAVIADDALMLELNKKYRQKATSANVLSFLLTPEEGEIFVNKNFIKDKNYSDFLFLHSLLHLKGYDHGEEMEKEENRIAKKFKIKI